MKYLIATYFLISAYIFPVVGTNPNIELTKSDVRGHVKITVIRLKLKKFPLPDLTEPFDLQLVGTSSNGEYETHKLKLIQRVPVGNTSSTDRGTEFFKDEYEIDIELGVYKLEFEGINYEFSRFLIEANETRNIEIFGVFLPSKTNSQCDGDDMFVKTIIYDGPVVSKNKYHEIRTDNIVIKDPLNLIISYCRREIIGNKVIYFGTSLSYNGFLLDSEKVVYNKKNKKLTLYGTKESPIVFKLRGKKLEIVEFDTVTGKISRTKEF